MPIKRSLLSSEKYFIPFLLGQVSIEFFNYRCTTLLRMLIEVFLPFLWISILKNLSGLKNPLSVIHFIFRKWSYRHTPHSQISTYQILVGEAATALSSGPCHKMVPIIFLSLSLSFTFVRLELLAFPSQLISKAQ